MANILNDDFKEFLKSLNEENVEYILVGGYAVIFHGYSRTTGDLDIWVNQTFENYRKLEKAFSSFGMPVFDMTKDNFLNNPNIDVFTFGRPPVCIDIMNKIKGLQFNDCYRKADIIKVQNISVRLINLSDLLKAKKASNRPKDQDDRDHLT